MKTHHHRLFGPSITAAAIGLSFLLNSPAAETAAPLLEKQNLFEARTNGYWTCRIPGIAVTKNNTVLVTTEARPGRGGDYDFNDVLMRRSTDGGKSFGPVVKLVDHTAYGDGPVNNFVMIPDRDSGRVVAVFCHDYARVFTMHSDDDGATWSKPVEITSAFEPFKSDYPWRVCATGPDHGTQLRNGRMIIPIWLSDGSGKEFGKGKHRGHRPSIVAVVYSDDRGTTWKRGGIVCRHGDVIDGVTVVNPSETVAVELADGRVMFNMRSESKINRRLVAISPDGVSGWTGHRWDSALLEPVCMASLIRHGWPKGRQPGRILFANPSNLENELIRPGGSLAHDRKRLTIKMSLDDGATWPVSKILEPGPAGYSDIAVLADGTILCLYEADIVTRMCDDRYVRLARFNLEWLKSRSDQPNLPTVDISGETSRHVIVAQGTETVYQGHPTTLLLPDGKTMFCVWTLNHGGPCGPMRRSDDGGRTWSELLPVPENWAKARNCPTLHRLTDPQGKTRLFVFAGQGPGGTRQPDNGTMQKSYSMDEGKTWTPMSSVDLECVMPFCAIVPIEGGKKLLGMTNIRRPGEAKDKLSNIVAQSLSEDGGLTWTAWRIVLDLGELKPCEPALVRSPDGKQLLCLLRENKERIALYMTSDDEGRTWSKAKPLPAGLHGDRHMARYAADGRLVVCFRDTGKNSPTKNHFVAWVGRYEGILAGRDGQYRIKLLHSYKGSDCGYPGLELLPDGTFVATTYIKYRPGPEKNSVVSVRFKLDETDKMQKKTARPQNADGQTHDLVVIGGTPGGIACAVRAAREGLRVLLVNRHGHLGGIVTSGLGVWDTQWEGKRSPIYDEVRAALFEHYRVKYGADSPQYRSALPGASGHTNGRYEPRVAEQILEALVRREKNLTVLKNLVPVAVERQGALLKSLTLAAPLGGGGQMKVRASIFADCTYEGDLAALAKVPYRVGRESREEHGEPHAGILFMRPVMEPPTPEVARLTELRGRLKLRKFSGWQAPLPQSTGAADGAVQACNYRTILTTNPANRVPIAKPANYDPYYLKMLEIFSGVESIPNGKFGWNRPQLIGLQTAYVEAGWAKRQRIMDEHWDMTLGLLYFLQHDPTVPEIVRHAWLEYGLAKDEFAGNGHRPYEMYVREARRIAGRALLTEHDATLPPGLERAPSHADSVAVTEWYMDSHSCTLARIPGALEEGKAMLHQETFPGQIPYRCLLPQGVDNLLVPVCLSATHVAWGTVRLEPVFMQTGESAGFAAALAARRKTAPASLDPDLLVKTLAKNRVMVSFFNDVDVTSDDPRVAAAQYFGTKGFFRNYDARLDEPLTESVRALWQDAADKLRQGVLDTAKLAVAVHAAEAKDSPRTETRRGDCLLQLWNRLQQP
ncbi:MAG: FAD-dependent oxidoreductase [Verrucomicrobia bacterium]|nr:FAD-dependent oxidoreductase [Verrucomicrobiota bacterium]